MPLINCEIHLLLTWSEKYVLSDIITQAARDANANTDPRVESRERIDAPTSTIFQIKDTKFYVLNITFSTEDDNKFLEQLKSSFKRTIKWNKYRSDMTSQAKSNNLNYLIDPTLIKVNILFALSFENGDWEYLSKPYKLIAIDLSKQIELENSDLKQQINFIDKLEDDRSTMFFIIEKSGERTFEFSQISLSIT